MKNITLILAILCAFVAGLSASKTTKASSYVYGPSVRDLRDNVKH